MAIHCREVNFDGLVGPTHNYAGLSHGNTASTTHKAVPSNPRAAALQGLLKAKTLADWGFPQAVLPPQDRPSIEALKAWGFAGKSDEEILAHAAGSAPALFAAACSASSMWTANACTAAPAVDARDHRLQLVVANLSSKPHRAIEAPFTFQVLSRIFADPAAFCVHPPIPGGEAMADEGAANHSRLCSSHGLAGLHLFVYGRSAFNPELPRPQRFPARQTLESAQASSRLLQLPPERSIFLQQSPEAIDAGVFHNDVISVGHLDVFIYHEKAFVDGDRAIESLAAAFLAVTGRDLRLAKVEEKTLSLAEAVKTYLFNSQLLGLKEGRMLLAVPSECLENGPVSDLLSQWVEDRTNPIKEIVSFNLRESMRNGGGPACLRQRIVLSDRETARLKGRVLLDQSLYRDLVEWVERHYRDRIVPGDLLDPQLLEESRRALDELSRILELPGLYTFQH